MPDEPRRVYWDANVLLSYVDGDPDRLPTIEELLRQSRAREIEIVTSALSQVEVAFAASEKEDRALDPEAEERIDELWKPSSPIALVEFYPALARQARSLIREAIAAGRPALKPADAIHLATAARMEVEDFHTYDEKLQQHSDAFTFPVREPFTPQPVFPVPDRARPSRAARQPRRGRQSRPRAHVPGRRSRRQAPAVDRHPAT